MKTKLIVLLFALAFNERMRAQDAYFSNTSQSLLRLNPSFAGSNGGIRNQLVNRSEKLSSGFNTIYNSFDIYLKSTGSGIGLSCIRDADYRGRVVHREIGLSYAQWISLADDQIKIVPSLQVAYLHRTLDWNSLFFNETFDLRYSPEVLQGPQLPARKKTGFNLSSGLLFVYKHIYAGFAVHNVNQPDIALLGVTKMPARFNWHASYNWKINEKTIVNFSGRAVKQGAYTSGQLMANAVFLKHVCLGIGYGSAPPMSSYNVLLFNAGIRTNFVTVMLGYEGDASSDASGSIIGSWEMSLSFTRRNKENRKLLTDLETW